MNNNQLAFKQFQTILCQDVQFKGVIQSEDDILIAGKIDGEINSEKSLHLLNSAQVGNTINAENCTLHGAAVSGEIKLRNQLKMCSGSNMSGTIETLVLDIEAGALINGEVKMSTPDSQFTQTAHAQKEGI